MYLCEFGAFKLEETQGNIRLRLIELEQEVAGERGEAVYTAQPCHVDCLQGIENG